MVPRSRSSGISLHRTGIHSVFFPRFGRFAALYRRHFRDHRRERMFLASLSFLFTFGFARLMVHGFRSNDRAVELWIAGTHIHHYVWGILVLLLVGYLWLIQVGTASHASAHRFGRLTALLYGLGAALTLDEFALWLHLEDVYWEQAGRASLDAVVVFAALVSAGLWGGPFCRAALRQVLRVWRRKPAVAEVAASGTAAVQALEEALLPDLAPPLAAEVPAEIAAPALEAGPARS